jgi:ribonuclease HI
VVDARDSLHAELLALLLAMSIAHARNVEAVTFRHDATLSLGGSRIRWRRHIGAATEARKVCRAMLAAHPRWKLKQVPRGQNVEANILARRVLKMEIGNEVQKSHCREAKQREQAA